MKTALFSPDIISFLATLGWNADDFYGVADETASPRSVKHPTIDGVIARRPSSRSKSYDDTSVFVLDYSGTQYSSRGLIIESKTIETGRPQWQKAVMLWYTRTVFTVEQISIIKQNQQAEAEARRNRYEQALHALLPDAGLSVPDLEATGSVHLNDDGNVTGAILRTYPEWRFPPDASYGERLRMLADLAKAYRDAGFIRE